VSILDAVCFQWFNAHAYAAHMHSTCTVHGFCICLPIPIAYIELYEPMHTHCIRMAKRPKRTCAVPGCPNPSEHGPCPEHARRRTRATDHHRGSPSKRGYDRAWERLRDAKLAADPVCEIQTHCRFPTAATEVDHKIPIRQRPDLRLDWDNLQSACRACHSAKTARENGGFGNR